jgi:hypothetical protein
MYLYGESKIHEKSEITTEKSHGEDWEFMTVTHGRKKEQTLLNREPGTDDWYDSDGNLASIRQTKKKPIKTYSKYD